LHPLHVAVRAFRQELPQALRRFGYRIGPRDADDVEAVFACRLGKRAFQSRRIGQKSRSA
jgi:hypothetical protein